MIYTILLCETYSKAIVIRTMEQNSLEQTDTVIVNWSFDKDANELSRKRLSSFNKWCCNNWIVT